MLGHHFFMHTIVIMDLTSAQRVQILSLASHTSQTQNEIARNVGCTQSAVSKLLRKHRETGSISPSREGKCGRKRIISERLSNRILQVSKKDPTMHATEIKEEIGAPADHLSTRRIREHLQRSGRSAYRPMKKPLLTTAMKSKRFLWAKHYSHWTEHDWAKVSYYELLNFSLSPIISFSFYR